MYVRCKIYFSYTQVGCQSSDYFTFPDYIETNSCQQEAQLILTNPRDAMLCHPAKFGEDRTMRGRVIAYFRFSRWRPSAILDLVWRHSGPPKLVFVGDNILLNCTLILFMFCEISRFLYLARLAWNCLFTSILGEFWGYDGVPLGIGYRRQRSKN